MGKTWYEQNGSWVNIRYDYKYALVMFSVERGIRKFDLREAFGKALRSKINGIEVMHIDIMKKED